MKRILAINPGATSTKVAVFDDAAPVFKETMEHHGKEMEAFARVFDQYPYRQELIRKTLEANGIPLSSIEAVVGRGGLLKPLEGGTYQVNEAMVEDLRQAARGEHASNLGGVLAYGFAQVLKIPAFIVDPVTVDELDPVARISGIPDLERVSMAHVLNMKAVARKVAVSLSKSYEELNLVIAHLGTGISLSVHHKGRMIDFIDGKEEGAFAPDRCGGLPASQLVKLCYSGKYTYEALRDRLFGKGGFYAYLGTKDLRIAEERVKTGDETAKLILQAFTYQVAKDIAALASVVKGNVDRIILTGGIAYSEQVVAAISERVVFIAPVAVMPGEEELESLAAGALRVLNGEETVKTYA